MSRQFIGIALLVFAAGWLAAKDLILRQPQSGQHLYPVPLPVGDSKKPVLPLLEDDAHLLRTHLNNDNGADQGNSFVEEVDVYSGTTALKVNLLQKYKAAVPGWKFPIREKPGEGEFRYLRFAWKKLGGAGIMVQLHDQTKTWCVRYHSGLNVPGWESKEISPTPPGEWTVVTRDLFADYGELTITGAAFTSMDGGGGLFDHVALGRTIADLDQNSKTALGQVKPKSAFEGKDRDAAWALLLQRDGEKAGEPLRQFLSTAPDQLGFIRDKLKDASANGAEKAKLAQKLILDLDESKPFDTRLAAEEKLIELGSGFELAVRPLLTSESAELRYRAARIFAKWKLDTSGVSSASVAAGRIARIVQRAGNDESKKLLAEMAKGDFGLEFQALGKRK